jgi:tetraacyldisaccharide 4'-kinase
MKIIRKILFPFAVLYDFITAIRNFLYDKKYFKYYDFKTPIIAVGNLNVGGTGKTPQIEYLIRLLSNDFKVATLSRGYKRNSKGFVLANKDSNASILGDEPYQFFKKFKNIFVAVDADRKNGIEKLLTLPEKPEIILLDDAFQHRKVKASLYILLTKFNDLFVDDFLLPMGNLRESGKNFKRAQIIVVTKCAPNITAIEMDFVKKKIAPLPYQKIFFSTIEYDDYVYAEKNKIGVKDLESIDKLLIAGIANPQSFFTYFNKKNTQTLAFPDHHNFTKVDLEKIALMSKDKIIITTEKDYTRLKGKINAEKLYYLPIRSKIIKHQTDFDEIIFKKIKKILFS